jgi:hypothetical protein
MAQLAQARRRTTMHTIAHILGVDDPSGHWYLFWSGIGADLGEAAALSIIWRRINCHTPGCWRIDLHHTTNGTHCHRHHPTP